MNSNQLRYSGCGFSLIELMTSIVIGGLVVGLSLQLMMVLTLRLHESMEHGDLQEEGRRILLLLAGDVSRAVELERVADGQYIQIQLISWTKTVEYRRARSEAPSPWHRRVSWAGQAGRWGLVAGAGWDIRLSAFDHGYGIELSHETGLSYGDFIPDHSVNH